MFVFTEFTASGTMSSVITEGLGRILLPQSRTVFYNRAQVTNRDISIAAIQAFINQNLSLNPDYKPVKVLEALAASGLRSIRYFQEISHIDSIVVNDIDPVAVENIKKNILLNNLSLEKVKPQCSDAKQVLSAEVAALKGDEPFDIIDLDPYGTCSNFVSKAVESIAPGGLLCVTSTDMRHLAGLNPEACFSLYGSIPLNSAFKHEMAVRILLHSIQRDAIKNKRVIEPLLSLSLGFYVRLFLRVRKSPFDALSAAAKTSLVFECTDCGYFTLQSLAELRESEKGRKIAKSFLNSGENCPCCRGKLRIGGPIYNDGLHDHDFVTEVINVIKKPNNFSHVNRLESLVITTRDEMSDVPLYYDLPDICSLLKIDVIPWRTLATALANAGYSCSRTHSSSVGFKTNAPYQVVLDILKEWARECSPPFRHKFDEGQPGLRIWNSDTKILDKVDWMTSPIAHKKANGIYNNPERNWGPQAKAGRTFNKTEDAEKVIAVQ